MAKFGTVMVRQFHEIMQARVQNDEEFSESVEVTNGVKQLFYGTNTVQHDAFQGSDTGTVLMAIY